MYKIVNQFAGVLITGTKEICMRNWKKEIKIKHLFTNDDDHKNVQETMNKIADILKYHDEFSCLDFEEFENIPQNNEPCSPLEAANNILDEIYYIADAKGIWIG